MLLQSKMTLYIGYYSKPQTDRKEREKERQTERSRGQMSVDLKRESEQHKQEIRKQKISIVRNVVFYFYIFMDIRFMF